MLIVPLHRPLTWSSVPWITVILLLLNLGVYFVLQGGDDRRRDSADAYYHSSGLAKIEAPLYATYREGLDPAFKLPDSMPAEYAAQYLAAVAVNDRWFREQLDTGALFASPADQQQWRTLEQVHQNLREQVFTDRFVAHSQAPRPDALLVSMFMHGSLDHLLGNMLFLLLVGFLVEGVLGGWRYLLLYLASGVGASLAHLAWSWGEPSGALGASGAIAGLMGAVSVLWGLRKIRFFYWFFVIFDYVRAPAIVLLPLWLGWELAQMLLQRDTPVAYAAHAGGLVGGALLAWAARGLRWTREDGFAETPQGVSADPLIEAQALLAQVRPAEADALLAPLAAATPARLDVALCRYRVARCARADAATLHARAEAVLAAQGSDAGSVREKWAVIREFGTALGSLSAVARADLAGALAQIGEAQAALTLLGSVTTAAFPELPLRWLQLAHRLRERQHSGLADQALRTLLQHYPDTAEARKAQFLLEHASR